MKLKLDEQGHVVVQEGKPVYTHDDGKDVAFDAPSAVSKITALNAEAKGHREAKETAEAKAKAFEGIEDPDKARAALATVANLDAGQLVQAGQGRGNQSCCLSRPPRKSSRPRCRRLPSK